MAKNTAVIPYTELTERIQKLARVGDNTLEKIRGVIQDIYLREIPAKYDWTFLFATTAITTNPQYSTGALTVNTGDTTVTGNSSVTWTASMVGNKIKIVSSDPVYDIISLTGTTSFTISPAFWAAGNVSGGSYSVFKPYYTLPINFDRFPKAGGIYRWAGGRKQILEEDPYSRYVNDDFSPTASTPQKVRLLGYNSLIQSAVNSGGTVNVEFIPPPRDQRNYGVDYIRQLTPLYETTAGTLSSIAASATAVIGNTNTRFSEALTDGTYYFRVDALGKGQDSTWYLIVAIPHDSSLTLGSTFANTAITSSANYTIAKAPEMPARLHHAVLYGALRALMVDQNDPNTAMYQNLYAQTMSDAKKIYVSRPYSQEVTGVFEDYRYRR